MSAVPDKFTTLGTEYSSGQASQAFRCQAACPKAKPKVALATASAVPSVSIGNLVPTVRDTPSLPLGWPITDRMHTLNPYVTVQMVR